MRGSITVILITAIILSGMQLSVAANPDTGGMKIYHNEDWDLLLLYPEDWDYIEGFGEPYPGPFEGEGSETIGPFDLDQGMVLFKIEYKGSGTFSASLTDREGKEIDLLLKLDGKGSGSKTLNIKETGKYLLNVNATTGSWRIFVNQEKPMRTKVPVILHPPEDESPDAFIMVYFLGESVFEDIDAMSKDFEDDYLASYETFEVFSEGETETKEGHPAIDYGYSFTDHEEDFISNSRLIITDEGVSWMILFDRPPGSPDYVVKEGIRIINSIVFSATDYLSQEEEG